MVLVEVSRGFFFFKYTSGLTTRGMWLQALVTIQRKHFSVLLSLIKCGIMNWAEYPTCWMTIVEQY